MKRFRSALGARAISRRGLLTLTAAGLATGIATPRTGFAAATTPTPGAGTPQAFLSGLGDFLEPPYSLRQFRTAWVCFYVEEDEITKICTTYLNDPFAAPAGSRRFKPQTTTDGAVRIHVVFNEFPEVFATKHESIGSAAYTEAAVFFDVIDCQSAIVPKPSYSFFLLLLLDEMVTPDGVDYYSASPITIGRELVGLPKVRGDIVFPTGPLPDTIDASAGCPFPAGGRQPMPLGTFVNIRRAATPYVDGYKNAAAGQKQDVPSGQQSQPSYQYHAFELANRRWIPEEIERQIQWLREHPPAEGFVFPEQLAQALANAATPATNTFGSQREEYARVIRDYPQASLAIMSSLRIDMDIETEPGAPKGQKNCWLGIRQLHDPGQFTNATRRELVASEFTATFPTIKPGPSDYPHVLRFGDLSTLPIGYPGAILANLKVSQPGSTRAPLSISGQDIPIDRFETVIMQETDGEYCQNISAVG